MSSILLTPPLAEPLSLAEAKVWLRVEHADDDALITALIASARIHVEALSRRALIAQSWRIVRDAWPRNGRLDVLPAPIRQVTGARVYDAAGGVHPIDPQAFSIDNAAAPSVIAFSAGAPPRPGRAVAGIEIDIVAGYGADAAAVAEPLKQAIRRLLADWYENRTATGPEGGPARVSSVVAALIAPYRVLSL